MLMLVGIFDEFKTKIINGLPRHYSILISLNTNYLLTFIQLCKSLKKSNYRKFKIENFLLKNNE